MVHPISVSSAAKKVLITGLSGFTGQYVATELEAANYEVIGKDRSAEWDSLDLCDRSAVIKAVSALEVDAVVHLAGISFIAHEDADAIYRVNIVGTRNLLEAIGKMKTLPRIIVLASSANVYGNSASGVITEDAALNPINDYAVSKLAMENMAHIWMDRLPIIIARPFNYTGLGQTKRFLIPKIVDHYQRRARTIELGNTKVVREFMDVRDVAALYRALVEHGHMGQTLNLCSGEGHSLQDVINILAEIAGYEISININQNLIRKNEISILVGSPKRVKKIAENVKARQLKETLSWMYHANAKP